MIHKKVENPSQFYRRTKWAKVRKKILRRDPICRICKERTSTQVDHKIPVKVKPELRYAEFNLMGLCIGCHSRKTRADKNRKPINPPKRGADESGLPTDPNHEWNKSK